jgi:pimeloyl-ACP methyl ester carboxylesterase
MLAEVPGFFSHPGWFGQVDAAAAGRDGGGTAAGYRAHGWELGINQGISHDLFDRMLRRLDGLAGPVSLVGWSLGGLYARELAKLRPDAVDRVVTLGSPFSGDLHANRAWKLYEWVSRHPVDAPPVPVDLAAKPPVLTFALWSAEDGIVAPASSRGKPGETDRAIEVACRHVDFVSAPVALAAVLDALEA